MPENWKSPVYYLIATAGFPNFGDELILRGWLRHLAETAPHATVWVDTHSPGSAQMLVGDAHPKVRFTDTLWRLCWEAPSEDPWEVAAWVQHALGNPGLAPRWHQGIMALRQVDVVHVVGGGYVNRIWPHHVGLLAGAAAAARLSGARAAMTGHGLTPEPAGSGPLLRALIERFTVAEVRDAHSAELLDIATGIDDAFLCVGREHVVRPRDVWPSGPLPEVMLCLQSDLSEAGNQSVAGAVLAMLRDWQVSGEDVCVVEGIPRVDREVYALIEHELPGAMFYPFADVWEKGLPVSGDQVWISTRFHMHMAAAAAGAGGVALAVNQDYYVTKHQSLIDLGSGWTLVADVAGDAMKVPARPAGGGFATGTVERLRQRKLGLAREIYRPA
ncbi:polysaccharide pyruvyl transferase family protein [Mycobacterium sp. smrl_JER01]|uniref:polysaccharide pyruvyl transferase family protein n=1 Tax=Mycobacterium sp. smrl_JER01 TaxID=3402633 RepID=UPI003ACF6A55